MAQRFIIHFWGARGAVSAPGSHSQKYGGNTACVEMRCGEHTLIFDAGSGLRKLGTSLMRRGKTDLHLLFTHCHYDHISGLPFFDPFFDPRCSVAVWSGHLEGKNATQRMIENYMRAPYFPVGPEVFRAKVSYRDFSVRDTLTPVEGVVIRTGPLNHQNKCVGYRVEFDGRVACYITDTEHRPEGPDENILALIQDADLVLYDATYTDAEYPDVKGYGHSTWEEGVRLCKKANVKRYGLFHHDPSRTDAELDWIDRRAKKVFEDSFVVREGSEIKL